MFHTRNLFCKLKVGKTYCLCKFFLDVSLFLHHTDGHSNERVNMDEHRTHDNVRVVRDRPKTFTATIGHSLYFIQLNIFIRIMNIYE